METPPAKDAQIRKHVFRSTASNLIGQAVILGVGFLLAPFVLRRIGAADYGLWVLVSSLTGYASVLEFGISSAVIKYVAEYRVRGEREQVRAFVATSLSLYTALGVLAVLFSLGVALLLPHFINVPPGEEGKAARLVLLAGVALGLSIPSTIVVGVLRGLQRFDLLNLLYVINTLLSAGATIAVLLLGWGVIGIAAVAIPVTILTQIPGLWLVRRADPEMRIGWRGARRDLVPTVTGFSFKLFVTQVSRQLQKRTDEIVIAGALPIASVTPYSFGRRLGEIPNQLANQLVRTLMPLASGLHAERDWARLRGMYFASTRVSIAIAAALAAVVAVLAPSFLRLWVGPEYAQYWPVVALISLSSVAALSIYPAGAILQGMDRHKTQAITSILNGALNLVLSLILVRRLGIVGVALGTLIPIALEAAILTPYTLRQLRADWRVLLRDAWLPALAPTVPAVAVLYALQASAQPSSFFALGAIAAAGLAAYGLVYFVFRATAGERQVFQGFVMKAVALARGA
jgi:O-antigen/teichoic acid export membrane protein